MRKTTVLQSIALALVNGWLLFAVCVSSSGALIHYREFDVEMPVATVLAIKAGFVLPLVGLATSILVVGLTFSPRSREHALSVGLFAMAISELAALALYFIALLIPTFFNVPFGPLR